MLALLGMYSLYILAGGKRSRSEKLEREREREKIRGAGQKGERSCKEEI